MHDRKVGIIAVLISAIIFGCMGLMTSVIYKEGGNSMSVTLYRFVLALPLLYFLIKRNKDINIKVNKNELLKIILVSIFGYCGTALLLYTSFNYLATGTATTIHFVYPVLVILAEIIFFKERPTLIKISSVILCVLGILLFYNGDNKINILGLIIAFTSGITYTFYIIYLSKSSLKEMNTIKLTFYLCAVSSVFLFIICLVTDSLILDISLKGWLFCLLLSLSVSFGAVCLFQHGLKLIGSQSASILSTFEPITSILIGIFIFNDPINYKIVLGFIVIVTASILVAVYDR